MSTPEEDEKNIPDAGAVFTFGRSRFADNEPNRFWIRDDPVAHVACGDDHTAVLTASGRLFTFGVNDWGQLGQGNTKTLTKPTCVKALKDQQVYLVACGKSHTIAALESGTVCAFGSNSDCQLGVGLGKEEMYTEPMAIDRLNKQSIRHLSAGAHHSAALLGNGELWIWGSNNEGQLGMDKLKVADKPVKLKFDEKIRHFSCGYYHTAVISNSGALYTFGEGELGKLGLGEDESSRLPARVNMKEAVSKVSCGGRHTGVLTESGKVFMFGDGSCGQLGAGTKTTETFEPILLEKLAGIRSKDVICGESHTAVISETKQVYMFGDGRYGKLGTPSGTYSNQFTPMRVNRFANFDVISVAIGGPHTVIFARPTKDDKSSRDKPPDKRRLRFSRDHTEHHLENHDSDDSALSDSDLNKSRRRSPAGKMDGLDLANYGDRRGQSLSSARGTKNGDHFMNRSLPPLPGRSGTSKLPALSHAPDARQRMNSLRDIDSRRGQRSSSSDDEDSNKGIYAKALRKGASLDFQSRNIEDYVDSQSESSSSEEGTSRRHQSANKPMASYVRKKSTEHSTDEEENSRTLAKFHVQATKPKARGGNASDSDDDRFKKPTTKPLAKLSKPVQSDSDDSGTDQRTKRNGKRDPRRPASDSEDSDDTYNKDKKFTQNSKLTKDSDTKKKPNVFSSLFKKKDKDADKDDDSTVGSSVSQRSTRSPAAKSKACTIL